MTELHFEPFVRLAALDDDQALIAWGGFWFRAPPAVLRRPRAPR